VREAGGEGMNGSTTGTFQAGVRFVIGVGFV